MFIPLGAGVDPGQSRSVLVHDEEHAVGRLPAEPSGKLNLAAMRISHWLSSSNPTNYYPDRWLKAAKEAGFGYAVLATRYARTRFALWPSKGRSTSNVGKYLDGRDLVREYVDALSCRQGLKVGFYYSPPDLGLRRESIDELRLRLQGRPAESPHLGLNDEPVETAQAARRF